MSERKKTYEELRSFRWFGEQDLRSFGHRSRAMQMGYDTQDWAGKPAIGIINTWSDILNRANLGMEVMHERNAHNFPLDLAAGESLPVALTAPAVNG